MVTSTELAFSWWYQSTAITDTFLFINLDKTVFHFQNSFLWFYFSGPFVYSWGASPENSRSFMRIVSSFTNYIRATPWKMKLAFAWLKICKEIIRRILAVVFSAIFSTVLKRIWKDVPMIVFKKCQYFVGKNVEILISSKTKKKWVVL